MAITISTLNLAARNMIKLSQVSSKTSKSFISYTATRNSFHEYNYYKQPVLQNEAADKNTVSSVSGGSVENSEMTFVDNHKHSHSHASEDVDNTFVPSVSSDEGVSGSGHSRV